MPPHTCDDKFDQRLSLKKFPVCFIQLVFVSSLVLSFHLNYFKCFFTLSFSLVLVNYNNIDTHTHTQNNNILNNLHFSSVVSRHS